jgi:ribosomal protein S18 acetylase RimI-like enzyme
MGRVSDAALGDAAATMTANGIALWRTLARANCWRIHDTAQVCAVATGGPGNSRAIVDDGADPRHLVPALDDFFAEPGSTKHAADRRPRHDAVDNGYLLEDHGGRHDWRGYGFDGPEVMHIMTAPPMTAGDTPPGLVINRVATPDALADFERTVVVAFPFRAFAACGERMWWDPAVLDVAAMRLFVGTVDGVPVGTALAFVTPPTIGIYMVAVLPAQRRRGFATALTRAAAAQPGLQSALVATDAGRPLYQAMGYRCAGSSHWWRRQA